MNTLYHSTLAAGCVAWLWFGCSASGWANSARCVTLDETVSAAVLQAPDMRVILAQLQHSETEVAVAGMFANPTLTAGGNRDSSHFYANLLVPVPLFGQRGVGMDVARAGVRVAQRELEVTRNDVVLGSRLAWIALWLAEREVSAQSATLQRRLMLTTLAQARLEEGSGSNLEVMRVRTEAERAAAEVVVSQAAVQQRIAELCLWFNDAECAQGLQTAGEPPSSAPTLSHAQVRLHAEAHPVARRAADVVAAAHALVNLEKRLRWPVVGVELGVSFLSPTPPDKDMHAALSFELPSLNIHGPLIDRAEAARLAAEADRAATQVRISNAARAAASALEGAQARAQAQTHAILPAAQVAATLAAEGYEAGAFDINSVLLAEQSLAEARIDTCRAMAEQVRAWALLEHSLGGTP